MKKRFCSGVLLAAAVLLALAVSVPAAASVGKSDRTVYDYTSVPDWPEAPEISAESAYMIELNSGAVLYDKNGEIQSYPASTTKILTALLTLESCSLDEEISFSHSAVYDIESGGHHYEFEEGEVLTVSECLQFLLVESVNEVANALAEHIAGSVDAFADLMNERAAQLGASGTHFVNPHGLNDENHYTTAKDMALILWECVQSEPFRIYASRPSVTLKGRAVRTEGFSTYTNHDLMLLPESKYYNSSVVCGKTGYTSLAGNTLVTYASRDGLDVICVIMQGLSDRFEDTQKLLDYAFDSFVLVDPQGSSDPALADGLPLSASLESDASLLIPKTADASDITSDFTARASDSEEESPVLGEKSWYYEGARIGSSAVTVQWTGEAPREAEPEAGSGEETEAETPQEREPDVRGTIAVLAGLGILFVILLAVLIRLILRRRRGRRRKRRRRRRRRR